MVETQELDPTPLTHPALNLPHISHGFFTRIGGVSNGLYAGRNCGLGSDDDRAAVLENRALTAAQLGVAADRLMTVYQVHSPTVLTVDTPFKGDPPEADGMVTTTPGLALGALAADCAPVLFAHREQPIIGACHAGWRGAIGGVTDAVVSQMESLGADRSGIVAIVGPTISSTNYEVGPKFAATFMEADTTNARFFRRSEKSGHAYFDLPGYLVARLGAGGLGTVAAVDACTYADPSRFFSYRRTTHRGEPDYGRQISAIAIKT
ncbi:MAG: peptidoglycan editing factor PgeF [Pseudomonadota bacterium]